MFSDFSVDVLLSPQLPGHWKQVLRCFLGGPGGNLVLPEGFPQIFPRNPFDYRPKTFVLLGFSLSEVFDTSSSGRRNIVLGPMESTWKKTPMSFFVCPCIFAVFLGSSLLLLVIRVVTCNSIRDWFVLRMELRLVALGSPRRFEGW